MNDLTNTVNAGLIGNLKRNAERLHQWVAPLSTEQLWIRPYPYGNSVGHLLLHLSGNLNYYIGAQISGTGYLRNRPLEFAEPRQIPKDEVLEKLDQAVSMVVATIERQQAQDWSAPYDGAGIVAADRFAAVLECCVHFFHHAGQIIYLSKEITRRSKQTG